MKLLNSLGVAGMVLMLALAIIISGCQSDEPEADNDEVEIDLTEKLLAYYPFNNNTDDVSGNGFDGTIINSVSKGVDRFGNENEAYVFDKTENGYIETTTTSAISESLSSGVTFSAWIKGDGTFESTMRILSNYNGSVNSDGNCSDKNGFNFGISDQGQLQITYATNGNAYIGRRTEPNSLGTEWTHVAGVWNGTKISSGFKLYINGEQEDTIDYELGSLCGDYLISALPFNIGIGNCQAGLCQPYDGSLDDVRIYNKVFENTEIKKLYEIEKEGME